MSLVNTITLQVLQVPYKCKVPPAEAQLAGRTATETGAPRRPVSALQEPDPALPLQQEGKAACVLRTATEETRCREGTHCRSDRADLRGAKEKTSKQ